MDAWQNSMIGTSEWGTSIDDFCQDWLLQNSQPEIQSENVSASFSTSVDVVYPRVSSSIQLEPLYQNCLFDTAGATFRLDSTFQPESSEEGNRALGKRPMSDLPTLYPNPISDAYHEVSTSNMVGPINTTMNYGVEFERLVEDSWAFISTLYSHNNKKSVEVSPLKIRRNVRSKRSHQFMKTNTTLVVFGEEMDIAEMPTPICSCTGVPRACRGWSTEGWTSTCCTASLSMYPLPTYAGSNRIVRLPGRRMGCSTFTKVVEKLLLEGYDLDYPIDLKDHWLKLGTNKYVAK